jgi:hypothetical protein
VINSNVVAINWKEFYKAALLETDWTKMEERVKAVETEIHKRRLTLRQNRDGTQEERDALINAMSSLRVLQRDAAKWQVRNPS